MKCLCAFSQQNVYCLYEAAYILGSNGVTGFRVRTDRGRGWRKECNLPKLTLYIGSFRVQLRSVPRPTYTASTRAISVDFSSPWPPAHSFPYSQAVFLIKAWNLGLINVACQVTPHSFFQPSHSLLSPPPFSMPSFISNFVNNVCFVRQNYYTASVHKMARDDLFWNLLLSE
jgi:hypothetical protein